MTRHFDFRRQRAQEEVAAGRASLATGPGLAAGLVRVAGPPEWARGRHFLPQPLPVVHPLLVDRLWSVWVSLWE